MAARRRTSPPPPAGPPTRQAPAPTTPAALGQFLAQLAADVVTGTVEVERAQAAVPICKLALDAMRSPEIPSTDDPVNGSQADVALTWERWLEMGDGDPPRSTA